MTTNTSSVAGASVEPKRRTYLGHDVSPGSWAFSLDHKRIGVMWFVGVTLGFLLGGTFALLLRTKLLQPGEFMITAQQYNRFFTLHGVVMIFFFLIPAIPGIFGNFLLPLMLGAKDVAFPRINLMSIWLWLVALVMALWAILHGGVDTGWTFYTPYSTTTINGATTLALVAVFIAGLSSIASGLNFIVTIHTMRAPGLTWFKLPLFVWSIYATSAVQLLATPVLGLTVLLVAVERFAGFGIFDPARGGDPILFQHLFWFYSHPAVYIMILPGLGAISEVVTCFSRNPPYGYKAIAYSSLGIAFVGFLVWGHHMFVTGQAIFTGGAFAFITMVVAIFSAAKTFSWVGTMYKGSIDLKSPMVYVFGFLFLFLFGGLTGAAIGTMSLDIPWHGTYFIVGHFHLIMVGSAVMAFLAGVHYWFPLMWGRLYNERRAFIAAIMVFVGFVGTFMPMLLLGNAGAPRRYYQYADRYQTLHIVITCFAYLMGSGLLLALVNVIQGIFWGPVSGKNPWRSAGFEWLADCPPLPENFEHQPVVSPESDPYHYTLEEVSHVD